MLTASCSLVVGKFASHEWSGKFVRKVLESQQFWSRCGYTGTADPILTVVLVNPTVLAWLKFKFG